MQKEYIEALLLILIHIICSYFGTWQIMSCFCW